MASRVGDEILSVYPDADLIGIPSFGGVFEVEVDGKNIFSKEKDGRFPIQGEIIKRIKELEFNS
ncbi:SelT/SelW/SelH family protein [Sulfurospirillum sp. 1307]